MIAPLDKVTNHLAHLTYALHHSRYRKWASNNCLILSAVAFVGMFNAIVTVITCH